ncbi:MAG: reverse transcriptase family protein [Candidatus Thiodiazotropha endolucinida]|nr:reverse transcriptase family protein [Candidatus Thiodiazotropha taylori]MCW4261851.1 reverse transcriptase family protein [Candidatus Thiodiazotropha endolucinida]
MLKPVAKEISIPLSILFNRSFREGKLSETWKHSNVIPLPKKGDNSEPSNFRPVSLLSGIGKLQERIVFKNMHNFLIENNLIYKYQSGFLPGHSTTFQLIDIFHHICQAIDNNQYSCMVFCDVSKAFDRVWHKGLVFKLRQYGFDGDLLNWLSDYLSDRKQRVVIKSCMSDFKSIKAGVPQGSVLGPLLFLLYVNDISESLLSLTRLFADDSSLFYSASSIADIEGIVNHDLHILVAWAKQWLVKFNPLKTEAMLFTLKRFENFPRLMFNDTEIKFVDNHKHLGLTLSSNCKWHSHIDNILNSAAKVVGIMRKLKFTLNRLALNQIYNSYVLPILEYSSLVWDGCTDQDANALEKLQNEAARIVTGLTRSVSLERLYKECGWVSLSERRKKQKLYFMYRSFNGQVPSYIEDLIPPPIRETTNYPLRNRNNISAPFCRTELFRNSCIPSSVTLWNNLDESLRTSSSINSFKYAMKNHYSIREDVPKYFIHGNRFLSVMHARIRNKCSNLFSDLYSNHLLINPLCECKLENEDAEHYFFRCPKYTNQRVIMFTATHNFHPLNLDILLYGNAQLTFEQNMIIFNAVHSYIKNTGRFSNNS